MLKIDLTDKQLEILQPLFEDVASANYKGMPSAIAAQIYLDGMLVKLLIGEEAYSLATALGGANLSESYASTAAERLAIKS